LLPADVTIVDAQAQSLGEALKLGILERRQGRGERPNRQALRCFRAMSGTG
jgi:hypothetical protein